MSSLLVRFFFVFVFVFVFFFGVSQYVNVQIIFPWKHVHFWQYPYRLKFLFGASSDVRCRGHFWLKMLSYEFPTGTVSLWCESLCCYRLPLHGKHFLQYSHWYLWWCCFRLPRCEHFWQTSHWYGFSLSFSSCSVTPYVLFQISLFREKHFWQHPHCTGMVSLYGFSLVWVLLPWRIRLLRCVKTCL